EGAHDRLTVRALAIEETVLVVADIIGFHHEMSARVRARLEVRDQNIMLCATHTHGGPVSMRGRLHAAADPNFLSRLEDACVTAIDQARDGRVDAELSFAAGADPDVARNRRHDDGPIDRTLPVLKVRRKDGELLAILVNYACHPVVLGADNRQWTGDYPHFVRAELEAANPGATAIFLTGCIGDLNTGHSAEASISLAGNPARSFPAAEAIGKRIAVAAAEGVDMPLGTYSSAASTSVTLTFERRERAPFESLRLSWLDEAARSGQARAELLKIWAHWARDIAPRPLDPLQERVAMFDWGGMTLVGMPGEIFAATALDLRAALGDRPVMLAGFCDDNPGYIPPRQEYPFGGYEVDEAHRFYGQPATIAPGCAEAIRDAALAITGAERV
ncbi:MAG: alkaline ceramidase, partial [Pseudomonadota bacterium]